MDPDMENPAENGVVGREAERFRSLIDRRWIVALPYVVPNPEGNKICHHYINYRSNDEMGLGQPNFVTTKGDHESRKYRSPCFRMPKRF